MQPKPDFERKRHAEYLEKHLESDVHREILESTLHKLETPLKKVRYKKEGEIKINTKEFEVEFGYRQLLEEDIRDIDILVVSDLYLDPEKWRVLTDFTIKKNGNIIFNLKQELPKYKVFLQPTVTQKDQCNAKPDGRYIIIRGDLSKPAMIISLLHEVGHCKEYESLDEFGGKTFESYHKALKLEGQLSAKTLAMVLERERKAWAYVLRKIRPILGETITRDDILLYIHSYALSSYSKKIREKIEKGLLDFDWAEAL
jgi:hypothetical protein